MEVRNKPDAEPVSRKHAEERCGPRYPFSPSVEAIDVEANTRILARLSDISRNGCYIDTINPFAKNAVVTLTITKDNDSFKTQSKVVYSKNGMGMGLLFTTADAEQLRVLGLWLGELAGNTETAKDSPYLNVQISRAIEASHNADPELRKVVSELIALMNAKQLLSDAEGMALLRKFSK
jgi:hypothetical protein